MIHRRSGLQQQPCRRSAAQLPTAKARAAVFTRLHRPQRRCDAFDVIDGSQEHSSVNCCCSSWPSESVLQAFVVSEAPVAPSPCKQKTRCEEVKKKNVRSVKRGLGQSATATSFFKLVPNALTTAECVRRNVCSKTTNPPNFPAVMRLTKVSDGMKELPTLSALISRRTYRECAQHRVCTTTSGFDAGKMMSLPLPCVWMDENIYWNA